MKFLVFALVMVGLAAAQSNSQAPPTYSKEELEALAAFSKRIQTQTTAAVKSKDRPVSLPVGPCKIFLCIRFFENLKLATWLNVKFC